MTNNKKPTTTTAEKCHYTNTDSLGFKSLSDLMGQRKAKFLGLQKLLADREKPRPFWKVLKDARKIAEYAENFIKKHQLIESGCANRARSIPKNATIRKEYVNCKKPNCYREKHGPYYYAYWKEGSKIKKKYIGQYRYEGQLQQVQGEQQDTTTDAAASNNNNKIMNKKRKKKNIVVLANE